MPWQSALLMLLQWQWLSQLVLLSELDCPLGIGIYLRAWPS